MLSKLTDNEMSDVLAATEQTADTALRIYQFIKQRETRTLQQQGYLNRMFASTKDDVFVFKGNICDMSYFWKSKQLALSDIETLSPDVKEAVKSNFNSLAQQGYVTLSADKTSIECTKKGMDLCNDNNFISKVCSDRIDVCADIKKVVKQEQAKRNTETASTVQNKENVPNVPTINYNDNLVSNTNEIISESAKKAGEASVKKVGETAIKKATEETAKQGAKAAVGTAAGVATAGAATAAQIAYELAAGGVKIIKNNIVHK